MAATNWRTKMKKQRELKAKGAALAYDRIVLLREIHGDDAYLHDCDKRDVEPLDELDSEVGDLASGSYLILCNVLDLYPRRDQWNGSLQTLIAEVIEEGKKGRKASKDEEETKHPAWKSAYHELLKKYEALEREYEVTKARLDELEKFAGVA